MKEFVRLILAVAGISLIGCLIADMLKKWQILPETSSSFWVIIPLNVFFIVKEVVGSSFFRNHKSISKETAETIGRAIEALLFIIAVITLISVPFVWFGTIEATINGAAAGR